MSSAVLLLITPPTAITFEPGSAVGLGLPDGSGSAIAYAGSSGPFWAAFPVPLPRGPHFGGESGNIGDGAS